MSREERDRLLNTREVIAQLHERGIHVTEVTLRRWRRQGRSPRGWRVLNGRVYYQQSSIERWLRAGRNPWKSL